MSALRALPTIAEEERPSYDGQPSGRRHLTMIADDVVEQVVETCGFTAAGIYMLLERTANRDGICRGVSYHMIEERGGISRRHAIRLVQQLRDAGFIEIRERVVRGRHLDNEFFLPRHLSGDTTPANNDRSGDIVVTSPSDMVVTQGSDTSGDTVVTRLKRSSNEFSNEESNERVIEPAPPATDLPDRPQTASVPFQLLWAIFHEQGRNVYDLSAPERGKQCKACERLMKSGLSEEQVRGIVRWLDWMSGVDAFDVDRNLPKWRAAGMPMQPQPKQQEKRRAHNDPKSGKLVY